MLSYFAQGISKYGNVLLGEGLFLIDTYDKPDEIHRKLMNYIRPGDGLYVGRVSAPAVWNGFRDDVNQWIMEKMKPQKDILWNNKSQSESSTEQFDSRINSIVGDLLLYACQLAKSKRKLKFPLDIVGMSTYLHGYIVALNSSCPKHFRCVPNKNKEIKIEKFDLEFFGEINAETIQKKCEDNSLDMNVVKESITRINQYFSQE